MINEFSASTAGDDVEYVELLAQPGADLSAYRVLEIEGDSGTGSPYGVVDEVIAFGAPAADGRALASLPVNALENGTLSLLLVARVHRRAGQRPRHEQRRRAGPAHRRHPGRRDRRERRRSRRPHLRRHHARRRLTTASPSPPAAPLASPTAPTPTPPPTGCATTSTRPASPAIPARWSQGRP